MEKPIIFSIDDDPQVLNAISRDLKTKYSSQYKIISTTSAKEALERVIELKNEARAVAMFICDQRMPEMEGVDFWKKRSRYIPKPNGFCLLRILIPRLQLMPSIKFSWIII
ncbi:response regulator [Chryseobacterium arachidis]|uniref:response regulator n=1 Tax=Chryseobacterium arachidis TaxID=1416778 RepID=UPI00361F288D